MKAALIPALLLFTATPAFAGTVVCTPMAMADWRSGEPSFRDVTSLDTELRGIVREIDLGTGTWREHLVGGREGVTGLGSYQIVQTGAADGTMDFIGYDAEDGTLLRVAMGRSPLSFVLTDRYQETVLGTCAPGRIDENE